MSDQKPIVRWIVVDEDTDDDCACPDAGWPSPEMRWAEQVDVNEQDCACPDAGTSTPSPPLHAGLWHRPHDLYHAALPNRHEIVFAPVPSTGIAVLNAPARHILDRFTTPRRLPQIVDALPALDPDDVVRTAFQLAQHGLLQPAEETVTLCFAPPHTLTAWLHVTNQCNLRCSYCYVRKSDEEMDETTGRAAVEAVFRSAVRHGFRAVKLKYAGGEPTLNFALVRSLHVYAEALAGRYGLELREVLLSNGVALSGATIVALRDMGIRLAISLDGVGAVHDTQRGAGTFAQVAQSVDRATALGLQPHLSITVTAQNVDGLPDAVAYALDRDLPFNLNFYREHNCAVQETRLQAKNSRLIEGMRAVFALIEKRLPRRSLIGGLVDRANFGYPHSRPCGVGQSYVVIDHHGRVARCQMEMGCAVGTIWEDDLLMAVRSVKNGFRNLEVDARGECSACAWRYWCAGGCPLLTYRLTGRNDGRSPYCEVYRALFPQVLRLEGLRLLKWYPLAA
jgi:uncharacterized protein